MEQINNIVDYIISKVKSEDNPTTLINLKLQKLLYYIQSWSYGITNKPLFTGDFQAWVHGPVNREVYDRFSSTKSLYSEITLDDVLNPNVLLDDDTSEFVDYILGNYMKYSGAELERLSHSEDPWITARGDSNPYARCEELITAESMINFYGEKYKEINS